MEYRSDSSEGDASVFNIVPNALTLAKIFCVPFKTCADIVHLMNGIEKGKHEAVWSGMTEERRNDVMDSMFTTWKRLTDEKATRVSSNPTVVVGDSAFFGIDKEDNIRVSSKNPSHDIPSSFLNPIMGLLASKLGESILQDKSDRMNKVLRVSILESNSSPIVDEITKLFGVSLNTPNDIDEFMNTILERCNALVTKIPNVTRADTRAPTHESPIVQSMDINTKSTSYAGATGASTKGQPKVISNFRPLMADLVFEGVNISIPRKVVEKAKHGLKRIMMNTKGFFFFKFDSRAGLEAVLEGGPWLIHKSLIILKNWSMDNRLHKEELTRIPIWLKLYDVPIQVFEEDGRSSFARWLIEVNSEVDFVDAVTIGIHSLTGDGFTKETIRVEYEWRPLRCNICKIFGHVHDHCPKKVASPPIVTSNVVTPTIEKTNDDNIITSNSYSALEDEEEDEEEEDFENVYDESTNLFPNTKNGGSSTFTTTAG
ncbi:zinc knuckle CX2CX4HX4C containing protein [Tanacetum coccineum]